MAQAHNWDSLWRNVNIFTADINNKIILKSAALAVAGGKVAWLGEEQELTHMDFQVEHDYCGKNVWVTPGLVDCHTHLVYAGQRAHEFDMRLNGASYEDIARAGGGILSTVSQTRQATIADLADASAPRLQALLDEGVTTVEIKSGYGLNLVDELKMLQVAAQFAEQFPVTIQKTFLGAHALPPEFAGRADDYIDFVCEQVLPAAADQGLVDAVDVFCERIGFSYQQTEKVFQAAHKLNLPIKCHAEQLSDQQGAVLAAKYQALSVDHLEYLAAEDVMYLKKAKTAAVLLPGAFYFLRETKLPPIKALLAANIPLAIATDCNPGSSPCTSLLLMLNMACTLFGLTPEQALLGVTINAARALGMDNIGLLAPDMAADFVLWDITEPAELAYRFGHNPCLQVVKAGKVVFERV